MTLGAFLRTVRHRVASLLVAGDMTRVCGNDGILICVFPDMVSQLFATSILRILRRMDYHQILAHSAIARLAEVD